MQQDDAHLVKRVLAGEQEPFRTLVMRHTAMVRAVIFHMLGADSSVDDIAQEAFLRSYKYLKSLSDPANYGGWLHGITRRVCLDFRRSRRKAMLSLDELGEAGADMPEKEDFSGDLKDDVHEAVMNLPDELSQVVLMRYVDKYTYEQMAEILDVSRATVSGRLIQARKLLREKLKDIE